MASRKPCASGLGELARMRQVDVERRLDRRRARRQHQDAIGQVDRFLDVVGDQQHRVALLVEDAPQLDPHPQAHQRVERRERLVHVQDLGLDHEGAGELDALEHAARQLVRIGRLEPVRARPSRRSGRRSAGLVAVAVAVQAEHQVLLHGQPREHRAVLRDHDARSRLGPDCARRRRSCTVPSIRHARSRRRCSASVDLPQPEGPTIATNSPSRDVEAHVRRRPAGPCRGSSCVTPSTTIFLSDIAPLHRS